MDEATRKRMASSTDPNWQTPLHILETVTEVLGFIDLDPASPGADRTLVVANCYFTKVEDGLAQEWNADSVFLNPPYGRTISLWTRKLHREWCEGRTQEFVALLPARVDTKWWRDFITFDMLVCFIDGRLRFLDSETGEAGDPAMFPSVLVYGPNRALPLLYSWEMFAEKTAHLGGCWHRYHRFSHLWD